MKMKIENNYEKRGSWLNKKRQEMFVIVQCYFIYNPNIDDNWSGGHWLVILMYIFQYFCI